MFDSFIANLLIRAKESIGDDCKKLFVDCKTPGSLQENTAAELKTLNHEFQTLLSELIRGVETGNAKRVEMTLNKCGKYDYSAFNETQASSILKIMLLCLRESYENSADESFEGYTSLLPVFVEMLSVVAGYESISEIPKFLFTAGGQFIICGIDERNGSVFKYDNYYEFHLQNLRDFIASPGYKSWIRHQDVLRFIHQNFASWIIQLAGFTRNRRLKCFANLFDTLLLLLKSDPDSQEYFESMNLLLPTARRAFLMLTDNAEDPVEKILQKHVSSSTGALRHFLTELRDLYCLGNIPELPQVRDNDETPDLTVSYVYRTALEEIMGDGNITHEEEEILQNLREFLEISPDKYQRLFEQVSEGQRLGKIPKLDRDFSAKAFIYRILRKTIEDGMISEDERAIISKVANALLISQDMLAAIFKEVKADIGSSHYGSQHNLSEDMRTVHEVVRYIAMEERMRAVLVTDNGTKLSLKAGRMLGTFRMESSRSVEDRSPCKVIDHAVAGFLYEPHVYIYPVIVVFFENSDIDPMRIAFRGHQLDPFSVDNLETRLTAAGESFDDKSFRLFNAAMKKPVAIRGVFLDDGMKNFSEGMKENKGKYAIMLVRHSSASPVVAVQKSGYCDLSGLFERGDTLFEQGNHDESAAAHNVVLQGFPEMEGLYTRLGLCCLANAVNRIEPDANFQKAFAFFKKELDLNDSNEKTLQIIGVAQSLLCHPDEAMLWLNKAIGAAPADVHTLCAIALAGFKRDIDAGRVMKELPDYISKYLATAWHMAPNNPIVAETIAALVRATGINLTRNFKAGFVSAIFQ